jgi:hypothetical protein
MSNYVKVVDFSAKDSLPTLDPQKIVRGSEIDSEFSAIQTAVATKADLASPAFTGSPTATTQAVNSNGQQIATTAFVRSIVPAGIISMWSGSVANIPSGWALCDGANSTPDLRNRFIVGAGSGYSVGASGGSADAVVVAHTHGITDPGHVHTYETLSPDTYADGSINGGFRSGTASSSNSTTGITVNSAGVSGTNANLPPYYALCFIMKT